MIRLTRINHTPLVLNCDLIEHLSVTPDTVITLTNGQVFMVLETAEEVIARVSEFQRSIYAGLLRCPYQANGGGLPARASATPGEQGSDKSHPDESLNAHGG